MSTFTSVFDPFVSEGEQPTPESVGCVAGDAQCYVLFCDFFDRVIEAHHQHEISGQAPEGDFNYDNLKVAGRTNERQPLKSEAN